MPLPTQLQLRACYRFRTTSLPMKQQLSDTGFVVCVHRPTVLAFVLSRVCSHYLQYKSSTVVLYLHCELESLSGSSAG